MRRLGKGGALPLEASATASQQEMRRKREKHHQRLKAKAAQWRRSGDRTIAELASEFGIHPNGIYNWKKQLLDGARAWWERGVSKSVVLLTGDRGFESISLKRRVACEPEDDIAHSGCRVPDRKAARPRRPGFRHQSRDG